MRNWTKDAFFLCKKKNIFIMIIKKVQKYLFSPLYFIISILKHQKNDMRLKKSEGSM